jgi:hypothetical protein
MQLASDFADVDTNDPNCLVIGDAGEYFSYQTMNAAFRFMLKQKEKKFFTLGRGYVKIENEKNMEHTEYTINFDFAASISSRMAN